MKCPKCDAQISDPPSAGFFDGAEGTVFVVCVTIVAVLQWYGQTLVELARALGGGQ